MNLVPSLYVQNSGRSRLFSAGNRHFSGERLYYRKIKQWKEPTYQELIESIKVWILLGYPSNIPGYPSNIPGIQVIYLDFQVIYLDIQVNTVIIHFQEEIRTVPIFPTVLPQWITFLIFISQKILYY